MKILFVASNCTSTDGYDQILRSGRDVFYQFGGKSISIADVGEKFNVRVEIRDIDPDHPNKDTNGDGLVDNIPVEIKLYVNGELIATRNDYIDASSGNYDTMPLNVKVNPVRACRDEFITFYNTYLDRYTAPKTTITVENESGLSHTVPSGAVEVGTGVTFTVSTFYADEVIVTGAEQVGEPTVSGSTKTYTFIIKPVTDGAKIKIEYVKSGITNKVDYSTLPTSAETFTTSYLKVSGNSVTAGTASDYSYVVVWQSNSVAGPALDGYSFGRKVVITSVKASGSNAETSFTVSGIEYKAGTVIGKGALLGNSMWGTGMEIVMSAANTAAITAPASDSTLRLVWDTDVVVTGSYSSQESQMNVRYKYGTNMLSTDGKEGFITSGNTVYYIFNGTKHTVAKTGEKFNIRIEIRESATANSVDITLFVNGNKLGTRTDIVDTDSGAYVSTAPNQVRITTLSNTRDEMISFSNTYLDRYVAP